MMSIREFVVPPNHNQVYFKIGSSQYSVLRLRGDDFEIHKNYTFNFVIYSKQLLCSQESLQSKCVLYWQGSKKTHYIHGVISSISHDSKNPYHYEIIFNSPLEILNRKKHSRVFAELDVVTIIKKFVPNELKVTFKLVHNYFKRPITMQVDETDLCFIERICAYYGIYYVVIQKETYGEICFTDNSLWAPLAGVFRYKNDFNSLSHFQQVLANRVLIRETNVHGMAFSASQKTKSDIFSISTIIEDDDANPQSQSEAEFLAQVRLEQLDMQREYFLMEGVLPDLTIGEVLEIQGYPEQNFNQKYYVFSIQFNMRTRNNLWSSVYLIPLTTKIRSKQCHPWPRIFSLATATITSQGDVQSENYYFNFKYFEMVDKQSIKAPLIQWVASPQSKGVAQHWALETNSQVAIQFIAGHCDRPAIIGAIANQEQSSPVTSSNPLQTKLQTSNGSSLIFEDDQNKGPFVSLATQNQKIQLQGNKDHPAFSIINKIGAIQNVSKYQQLSACEKIIYNSESVKQDIKDFQHIITEKGDISFSIKGEVNVSSKSDIYLQAQQQLVFKAKGEMNFTAGNDLVSSAKHLQCMTQELNVYAKENIRLQSQDEINIGNGLASISLNQESITLKAGTIIFRAPVIELNE